MNQSYMQDDQQRFEYVCQTERSFCASRNNISSNISKILKLHNQLAKTVGDGTLTIREFENLMERLAEREGIRDSSNYRKKLEELNKIYKNATQGR